MPDELRQAGGLVVVDYDSPLNRAQRAPEAMAIMDAVQATAVLAQVNPAVWDDWDVTEANRLMLRYRGVPELCIATPEQREQNRQSREQQQQQAMALAAAGPLAKAAKDAAGATLTGLHAFTLHFSEAATGAGLTADTYSGSLTASSGAVLGTMTAKKCFLIQTHTDGVFVGTLVDSANPADQYVAVKKPVLPGYVVSAVSGVNWQGI